MTQFNSAVNGKEKKYGQKRQKDKKTKDKRQKEKTYGQKRQKDKRTRQRTKGQKDKRQKTKGKKIWPKRQIRILKEARAFPITQSADKRSLLTQNHTVFCPFKVS